MNFTNQALTLHSDALPENTLMVTKLVGEERLSGLFRFELDLLCQDKDLDLAAVLYAPARLGIEVDVALAGGSFGTTTRQIAGVFAELEQQEEGQGWVKYRAVLVPKLWQLTRTHRSRIFMSKTIDELVTAVFETDGLEPKVDFEFQLSRQGNEPPTPARAIYPQHEYVVQYEENDWDFVARWLEHEGVYFYFVNDDSEHTEKVVFADTTSGYASSAFQANFPYRPEAAGKDSQSERFAAEEIYSFRCRQTRLPTTVSVNDYNWRTPSTELKLTSKVLDGGTGQQTEYNDHFKTAEQGEALAEVRGEELACRARWFHGDSSCRTFRPGATFTLEQHYRDDLNDSYLLVAVQHEAEQMISLESATITGVKYKNTFQAIPAAQAFRPARVTAWPAIKGVMNAKIDAEGSGKYAELDEHGRYKVTIPFDENAPDAKPGRASRWIRMAQPYAGPGGGMHFPLLKGTEVLITHIDGDPDRPIIAGAVPNAETESPTTGANRTRNSVRTAGGNVMQIDDDDNSSGFVFKDARNSRVTDFRWRTSPNATSNSKNNGSGPGSGGGGALPAAAAKTPADQLPTAGAGMADAGSVLSPNVSTSWDTDGENQGVVDAWKQFFGASEARPLLDDNGDPVLDAKGVAQTYQFESAFNTIAGIGRYSDQTTEPAALSAAADTTGALLSDTTLNAKNLVTMFNLLLKKHPRFDASQVTTPLTEAALDSVTNLQGKIGTLANCVRNFEGIASGSFIGVDVGDEIKIKVGDAYEYTDGSFDIKIGTGGYSREETRGDGTKDTLRWGKSTENEETHGDTVKSSTTHGDETETSFFYGSKKKFEFELSGSVSMSIAVSGQTENEIKIGGINKNEMAMLIVAETSILVGGKLELEINAAVVGKIELGIKNEFEMQTLTCWLSSDEVALNKLRANLQKDCADLVATQSQMTTVCNALSQTNNKLAETSNQLTETQNALNKNTQALSVGMRSLAAQAQILAKDDVALVNASKAAMTNMTSGVTMIQ